MSRHKKSFRTPQDMSQIVVATLYRFVNLPDFVSMREPLLNFCQLQQIKGTLLLAAEGINGTIAGSRSAIDNLLNYLYLNPSLTGINHKESFYDQMPFYRMKVKLKKEVVTMGVQGIDPNNTVGTYVKPKDWNELISDPNVTLVDTRNYYECAVGSFKGAINPNTQSFREFPEYIEKHLDPKRHKKVAMFCTGGIRCEKSTAYLKQQGFDEVYHLEGGILKYLEEVDEQDSLWQGECFVFDNRVTVNHRLKKGSYDQCFGCRHPITKEDQLSDKYQLGIACPYCYDFLTPEQLARFKERQKQIELAKERNQLHIGLPPESLDEARKLKKQKNKKDLLLE